MKYYQIAELEQLSGIKAHTIRIWEKRYGLIEPERTDTNIRLYNDDHVRTLLNVTTLIESGMKISRVAALSKSEMNVLLQDIQMKSDESVATTALVNELIASMLRYDELAFERAFGAGVTRLGMYNCITDIVYPFLHKIGVLWAIEGSMPVQEHFASSIIRRKLLSAIDGLPLAHKKNKKFLLFLPPGEWHELGLIFSEFIIRSKGYETIYLGQNVPYQDLKKVEESSRTTHALTFFIARQEIEDLQHLRKTMGFSATVNILVAGNRFNTEYIKNEKNLTLLYSPADLLNFL